jgi:hypothetical protein
MLARSEDFEMLRIDARSVATHMIDNRSGGYRPVLQKPCDAVSSPIAALKKEHAVTIAIKAVSPHQALPIGARLAVESREFTFRQHGPHGTREYMACPTR